MLMKIKIGITVERILAISNVTTCSLFLYHKIHEEFLSYPKNLLRI